MLDYGRNYLTVRIDNKKCKRCYECVRACTHGALTLERGIFMHNAYGCAYCYECMDACEQDSIEILEM